MFKVFFSYTKTHETSAKGIAAYLTDRFKDVWREEDRPGSPEFYDWLVSGAAAGENLWIDLSDKINNSQIFVAIICDFYAGKIAGNELKRFVQARGKRLIPVLLGENSDVVWAQLQQDLDADVGRDGERHELVWCDARKWDEGKGNKEIEDKLILACRRAIDFVLASATAQPEPETPQRRPGVVVMGEAHADTGQGDVEGYRKALVGELAGTMGGAAVVDLGDSFLSLDALEATAGSLGALQNATDVCLVSVKSASTFEPVMFSKNSFVANATHAMLQNEFDRTVGMLPHPRDTSGGDFDRKLRRIVWLVGGQDRSAEGRDGVDFAVGDARAVSEEVLRAVGMLGEIPFLVEDFGAERELAPWLQTGLPGLFFDPPSAAPRSIVVTEQGMREMLGNRAAGARRVLAITNKGAPPASRLPGGGREFRKHMLSRISRFEDMVFECERALGLSTFRLMLQIIGHNIQTGVVETIDNRPGSVWNILRVNPDTLMIEGDPAACKQRFDRFMASEEA